MTGKFKPDAVFKDGDHRGKQSHFQPENIKRTNAFLERIKPIAEDHGATLGQLVIAWTIAQPGITAAIVGARDAAQTVENLKAASIELSATELATINRELETLTLVAAS